MVRTTGVLVAFVATLTLWAAPTTASADPAHPAGPRHPPGLALSGTFVGTSTYEFPPDDSCEFVLEEYSGTYDPARRGVPGGTFFLDVCVFVETPGFGLRGTFEIASGRLTMRGTVDGSLVANGAGGLVLDVTLTVTESTGTVVPVRGTIHAVGTRLGSATGSDVTGTFDADLRLGRGRPR